MIQEAIEKYQTSKGEKLNLKAVLFDMDGVLFNSTYTLVVQRHHRSWNGVRPR
jgi:hypothetical protein